MPDLELVRPEEATASATKTSHPGVREFATFAIFFFLLHTCFMTLRYGQRPTVPVLGDEVIINDAALSLGTGHGYAATSFVDSRYGLDRVFAHFPPLYPLAESLAIRAFGISVYSLRLTTTVMSIAGNAVFLWLLYRLCRSQMLHPVTAILLGGIYSTFSPLIVLDRVARMESLSALLTLLALAAILHAITLPTHQAGPWLILGGGFAGLCLAVHPEAVTSVAILAPLALWGTPGNLRAKVAACAAAVLAPLTVCLLTFGPRSGFALHQFLGILQIETPVDLSLGPWLATVPHARSVSAWTLNVFFLCLLVLLLSLPVLYLLVDRKLPADSVRRRVSACFAVAAALELITILWGLHVNTRRYQSLFGTLLIAVAVAALGDARPRRWQSTAAGVLIAVQALSAAAYLADRKSRIGTTDPERFMSVVRCLPDSASLAAGPKLWLSLRQTGRPFALVYPGFDGQDTWRQQDGDPFRRFDVVAVARTDVTADRLLAVSPERREYTYRLGGELIDVFVRNTAAPLACR